MENIKKKLQSYPSSFGVAESILRVMTHEQKETIRSKLTHELESSVDEFNTTMERVRVLNLLSYLCFILGDKEKALDYNRKAIETNQCSIIALSNKAWLSLEGTRDYSICVKICEQLRVLQKDDMARLIATAEIAYTYTRLGLKHYNKAVKEFRKVIDLIEKEYLQGNVVLSPSAGGNNDSEFLAEYYCIWMYGCALPLRRLCNFNNMRDICNMEQIKDNYKHLVELYSRILELCADHSKCIQRYQARSYVELGLMAYDVTKQQKSFPHGMAPFFPENSPHMLQTREYFSKALKIFPDDVFVLERSGRYFRYNIEISLSIELLKKAVSIKETSFGHHHLALSYKRLLENDARGNLPRHFKSMTIEKKFTMGSGMRQNTEENGVESTANSNQESVIYRRSKTRNVLQDMQGNLVEKKIQTKHTKPKNKPKWDKFQSDSTASDRRTHCQRRKPHFEERKDKPGIKCPRDPVLINYEENKEEVDRIFLHLNRATELSTNTNASYDKALLYRQIKQPKKALDVLEQLMHQHLKDVNSPVMLANIYEQAAFCVSAMLDDTKSEDTVTVEQLNCNRDMYLKSSVEILCDLVAKMPQFHECWESPSTLEEILSDRSKNERNEETLRDQWFLYDKLKRHPEAIGVLKELKDLVEDDDQPEVIEDLVRRYIHLGNYEEAVITLRMTKRLQNSLPTIDHELYCQVHIEAGLDAFKRKHVEKARARIRQAIEYQCGSGARPEEMTVVEEGFELFVLSNIDCDDAGRNLTTLLTELGVKTTFNFDSPSVSPGTSKWEGMTGIMMKSEAFAILIDFDTEDKEMMHITERMQSVKQNRKDDPLTVVITAPGTELSPASIYSVYHSIHMNIGLLSDTADTENMLRDEIMSKSIKELLLYVAKRHCVSNEKHA